MTATTNQIFDLTRRGQEAVATAVRTWADTVQGVTGTFAADSPDKLSDLRGAIGTSVDQAFDVAEKVLATQRQLAHALLTAGAQATDTVTEQAARTAKSVSTQTVNAAQNVAEAAESGNSTNGTEKAARAPRAKS